MRPLGGEQPYPDLEKTATIDIERILDEENIALDIR